MSLKNTFGMVFFLPKIGFALKGYGGASQYYNANIKPFVDISQGLQSIGEEPILFIDEKERHLDDKIRTITGGKVPIFYTNPSNLERLVIENSVDYLIVDDDIEMMKTVLNFQVKGIKKGVFVQYLYGVNTNKYQKRKTSLSLTIGSYLPWKFLIKKYRDLLIRFDYIIPNSQTCGYILRQFYDLSPAGTVYPPVGVDIRPILNSMSINAEKSGILIFGGNIVNDYFLRNIKDEIKNFLIEIKEPVKLFVSNPETAAFFSQNGVKVYSKLQVGELIRLFAESRITYVPTAYELFGYVGAESVMCGTPAILDAYHPFLESFPMETNAVKIVHPNSTISEVFVNMLEEKIDIETAKKTIYLRYSAEESAKLLAKAIEL